MIHFLRRTLGPCLYLAVLAINVARGEEVNTQGTTPRAAAVVRQYKSARLFVRTDLPAAKADALYDRLEETLRFASRYWGRTPKGQIECYVVHDVSAWNDDQLPHRLARVLIDRVGGATVPKYEGVGNRSRNIPTVFASTSPGVAEHEIIHAYCIHTFGSSGPEWYKEGMAEMAVNRGTRESGMLCSDQQCETLRAGKHTTLDMIFETGITGKKISSSLRRMMDDPEMQGRHVSIDAWSDTDASNVRTARAEYLHSWAFCYMMLHNPNYSKRFRSLGNAFIAEQRDAFDEFFASARDRIEFEHRQFLRNASVGYRVDLCAWDWSRRFKTLARGQSNTTRVLAARGFQPTGVTITNGQRLTYQTTGKWKLSPTGQELDAAGNLDGGGLLIGVVLTDRTLSNPFPFGTSGTLEPPASGQLYLRCNDAWNEIADNTGQIDITISGT
ncbi:MAG: hypothetical protein H6822_03255 [Planctomycetaceae bacterium]|nr:hypothetical protein [Planctomycetales bacterium]MCB9921171.1 hypothetical protein [Planctomycetaceae bacterium]